MSDKTAIPKVRTPGRGWAYVGVCLGGGVSIAANIAHSFVKPPSAPVGWAPEPFAVVVAVFWPLALFVAVEIWSRVPWPRGWRFVVLRFAGLLPVAAVAAVVSYRHLSSLLAHYGEEPLTAHVGPLAVDGLMVMATAALVATGARRVAQVLAATAVPAATVAPLDAAPVPIVTAPVPLAPIVAPTPPPSAPPALTPTRPTVRPTPAAKAVKAAPKRQPSAAEQVVKAITRSPAATNAQIAARLKLSEATVQRHRRQAVDSVSTPAKSPTTAARAAVSADPAAALV